MARLGVMPVTVVVVAARGPAKGWCNRDGGGTRLVIDDGPKIREFWQETPRGPYVVPML